MHSVNHGRHPPGIDSVSGVETELLNLRRYLVLQGETDTWECPEWYPLIQSAKYLGVPPWELMEESLYWKERALVAMTAEAQAQEIINNKGNSIK